MYKDKEKEKIARSASMQRRIISRMILEFRVGDEKLLNAINEVTKSGNRTAYIKGAIREKLIRDGYILESDK